MDKLQRAIKYQSDIREALILDMRFRRKNPLTLQQIGEAFGGLSRERVRQIIEKAMTRKKHAKYLNQYKLYRQAFRHTSHPINT